MREALVRSRLSKRRFARCEVSKYKVEVSRRTTSCLILTSFAYLEIIPYGVQRVQNEEARGSARSKYPEHCSGSLPINIII